MGLDCDRAIALIQAGTESPFPTCSRAELVPLLEQILSLLHLYRTSVNEGQQWHA